MQTQHLDGGFSNAAHQSATAFRSAMRAMAMPGSIETIVGAEGPAPLSQAAATLVLTLCDPETPVFLAGAHDCDAVRAWVTFHTGAPFFGPAEAVFAVGTWDALAPHDAYAIGTAEYPDRAVTLIVERASLSASGARLTGPGIKAEARLEVPDTAFCQSNCALYPLGLDMFLTHGSRIAALPRSTKVR